MSAENFVNRLLVLYGSPDSPDDDAFIEEYRDMLQGVDARILKEAGNLIRATHVRRGWPTPGEVNEAVRKATHKLFSVTKAKPDPQEEFESVGPEDERFVEALTKARTDTPAYARILERRGFIRVKKQPRGPRQADVKGVVTDITKRMTGERE